MRRTVALYADQARTTRLMLEKMVKARKETIRIEIVQEGQKIFSEHIKALNKRIGCDYMPALAPDFAGAIKGKKTLDSLREAVAIVLVRAKLEANDIADRIQINLLTMRACADVDQANLLFKDLRQIVLKENDDFAALVKMRVAEHKAAEEKRLEAERERIRAEVEAEVAAKKDADARALEQAQRAEQDRLAAEAKAENQPATASAQAQISDPVPPSGAAITDMRPTGRVTLNEPNAKTALVRPTDDAIINTVAQRFSVSRTTAIGWIRTMD